MNIQPFGQRLIVKRLSEKERSGIVIPSDAALIKGSVIGCVKHCGPETEFVEEGDIILYAKYSGTELPVDGKYLQEEYENCLCMNEDSILGALVESTPKENPNA